MKNYLYTGKTNLTFTHDEFDHLVTGPGPHSLPEGSPVVQSNVTLGTLVLQSDEPKKVTNANTEK